MNVDIVIYVDGQRAAKSSSLQETFELHRHLGGVVWIDLCNPTEEEFEPVAQELELPPRAVEDAIRAHQRPKLVRYGDSLFAVLKPARYLDESEKVEISEVHVLVGKDSVVTVHYEQISALDEVRRRLEDEPELLRQGPRAI